MQNIYQNLTPFTGFNPLNHTQIWLATETNSQKKVLIKQLKQGLNPLQYEQLYNEYKVYQKLASLSDLEKNYFVNCVDFYKQNGDYFLVLEYYEGNTLKQLIAENQLNLSQKITLLIHLCHAIESLHSLEIIHCDIKPSNILISHNQVKLLDFGLAKTMEENLIENNFTAGTPAYMSPEQFTGGAVTYQTDYYSLGIVMYEILMGEKPFLADNLENWAIVHCQMPYSDITYFSSIINQQLNPIFKQLLAKFPVNRPQNLSQIIMLLNNLLNP